MKLYYYTGPEHLRENLQNRRVKVSRFGKYGSLNDPFELAPYDISNQEFRSVHKRAIDELAQKMGLICLSETRHSPAMWAHYAVNHTGACLEFEVTYDHIFKVRYDSEKLFKDISLDNYRDHLSLQNFKEVYGTKSTDWAYEKEHRMTVPLDNQHIVRDNGLHFMPFQHKTDNTFQLIHIWIGFKCGLGISNIMNDIKDYRHKVEVTQTRPAFESFNVVKQKDRRFWNMEPGDEGSLPAVKAVFG